ncbi:MAG TPA: four helix bundle protein [Pyrinomonadaceae bacterium]|jgi:four helix bundle protein
MGVKVERFEELIAWQKARALTREVYRVTGQGSFSKDFGLKDQMRRAAVSIMSNVAEGFERGRPSEFHQFLSVAKASCAELRSQLYIACDAGHIAEDSFNELMIKAVEVGRIIGGLRSAVERKRDLG